MRHFRRGIEPVVAAVILIAVAVALGIAVAFWASGLIGTMGQLEKLEIKTAYATYDPGAGNWTIILKGTNKGTVDVSIVEITINGNPYTTVGSSLSITLPYSVSSGSDFIIYIELPKDNTFIHGQTIEISLITGGGIPFKKTIELP